MTRLFKRLIAIGSARVILASPSTVVLTASFVTLFAVRFLLLRLFFPWLLFAFAFEFGSYSLLFRFWLAHLDLIISQQIIFVEQLPILLGFFVFLIARVSLFLLLVVLLLRKLFWLSKHQFQLVYQRLFLEVP